MLFKSFGYSIGGSKLYILKLILLLTLQMHLPHRQAGHTQVPDKC